METLQKEIGKFLSNYNCSETTKNKHQKSLLEFLHYLSIKTGDSIEEIHLEKVYSIIDRNGKFIMYKPIDPDLIDTYLFSHSKKGYQWLAMTRNSLGCFFRYLVKNFDFENVMKYTEFKLKEYKPLTKPIRILSRHEILKLFQSIVKTSNNLERDLLLFILLLSTGCRISELLHIKVSDIDTDHETLFLNKTKNKRSRTVYLRNGIGEAINEYVIKFGLLPYHNLFYYHKTDHPLTREHVRSLLTNYLKYANLPYVRIHSLRHSFATLMKDSGSCITIIQQLLGHEALSSTKVYIEPNYTRNNNVVIEENQKIYAAIFD